MPDIETQLRDYGEHLDDCYPDVAFEELIAEAAPLTARRPDRRGILVAVATGVLILVAVGGLSLLLFNGESPIVDEPVPTPTTVPDDPTPSTVPLEPAEFEGTWTSVSRGWPPNLLTLTQDDGGFFTFLIEDSGGITELAHLCTGWLDEIPATVTGRAERSDANALSVLEQVVSCGDGSTPPGDISYLNVTLFVFDPASHTIVDDGGREWRRVVASELSTPASAWRGIWPQATRDAGVEAQRLADAGDSEYSWQVIDIAPETDAYEDVATAFVREVVGWETYESSDGGQMTEDESVSVMGPGYGRFVRCDPEGSNPHYPELGCAPRSGNTFELITVYYDNLVRREAGGIAIVTGWVETTLEQDIPPAPDEVRRLVEAFLNARLAGAGAEEFISGTAPEGGYLYAADGDSRFVDAELVNTFFPGNDSPVELEIQWPTGHYGILARLTAEDGTEVHEYYEVFPADFSAGTIRWQWSVPAG